MEQRKKWTAALAGFVLALGLCDDARADNADRLVKIEYLRAVQTAAAGFDDYVKAEKRDISSARAFGRAERMNGPRGAVRRAKALRIGKSAIEAGLKGMQFYVQHMEDAKDVVSVQSMVTLTGPVDSSIEILREQAAVLRQKNELSLATILLDQSALTPAEQEKLRARIEREQDKGKTVESLLETRKEIVRAEGQIDIGAKEIEDLLHLAHVRIAKLQSTLTLVNARIWLESVRTGVCMAARDENCSPEKSSVEIARKALNNPRANAWNRVLSKTRRRIRAKRKKSTVVFLREAAERLVGR